MILWTLQSRASQNPIRPIRRTRAADFGPSLDMFKKAANIEFSYKIMYLCTVAENFFVMSCCSLLIKVLKLAKRYIYSLFQFRKF